MRFLSLNFKFLSTLLLAGVLASCGSYQNASYYSDGIYGGDSIVIIRKQNPQNNTTKQETNSYTKYFDEKAKAYTWEDTEDVVYSDQLDTTLSNSNNQEINSYPQWGAGTNTTQIYLIDNRFNYANPYWGNFAFFDPYPSGWNWRYRYNNPYYWNSFSWNRYNSFYDPFYPPFYINPWGYNPYAYGGYYGYGYGYGNTNRFFRNRYERIGKYYQNSNRVLSSTYRGAASRESSNLSPRSQQSIQEEGRRRVVSGNTSTGSSSRNSNTESAASLESSKKTEGRRQGRRSGETSDSNQTSRSGVIVTRGRNYSTLNRVIENYRSRGYNIQVINNPQRNNIQYGIPKESQSQTSGSKAIRSIGRSISKGINSSRTNSSSKSYSSRSQSYSSSKSSSSSRSSSSGRSSSSSGRRN